MDIPRKTPKFGLDSPDRAIDAAGNMFILLQEEGGGTDNPKKAVVYPVVNGKLDTVNKHEFLDIYGIGKLKIEPDGMCYVFGADRDGGLHDHVVPGWVARWSQPLVLVSPWQHWGSPFPAPGTLTRLASGLVVLEGVVKGGGVFSGINQPICRLPERCRPGAQLMFVAACGRNGQSGFARVYVQPSGFVSLVFAEPESLSSLSLSLSFLAAQ